MNGFFYTFVRKMTKSQNLFSEWLRDIEQNFILFLSNDINEEANGNLHFFDISIENRLLCSTDQVEDFLLKCVKIIRDKCSKSSMLIYFWVDDMASQLRLSLVKKSFGYLPFGCKIKHSSHAVIAREFIEMQTPLVDKGVLNVWVENI